MYWLVNARIAAKVGAEADVPPTTVKLPPLPVRNPEVQVETMFPDPSSSVQNRYPSWSGEALTETSGTSRAPSFGTPVPVCHAGFAKNPLAKSLAPPPVAESPPPFEIERAVSFHPSSGMYPKAVTTLSLPAADAPQYGVEPAVVFGAVPVTVPATS